jgi:4-amino-4-deoxy-L-arabinose transferase-like glycosyltransferase
VLAIVVAVVLLHLLTIGRYGYHRDELQFLSDAHHLDWGFVSYPPLAPFLARISLAVFGLSLSGLRLFPLAAMTAALLVTSLIARDLGGGRLAQTAATLSVALSPLSLFEATKFQYTAFDYLWWVVAAWCVVRLLRSEDPRWWLAIGTTLGIGLLTKYSILFLIAGIFCGMLFTSARRWFLSPWFWAGVAITVAVVLPNLLWEIRNGFISWRFLQTIHDRDIATGRTAGFLTEQFSHCLSVFAVPLFLWGLIAFLRSPRYRMLGWMYLIPLILFFLAQGRSYYLAPAYPMLVAMGSVAAERWYLDSPMPSVSRANSRRRNKKSRSWTPASRPTRLARRVIAAVFFSGLFVWGAWLCAFLIPLASSGPLRQFALVRNEDLRDEFGWTELVRTVAGIRDSLPPDRQAHLGVAVGNYGEQGAIEVLGPTFHLPPPISTSNSAWLRGYPSTPPTTLIVLGWTPDDANALFSGCTLSGRNGNAEGVPNEESTQHPYIFVCGPPRLPWPNFWKDAQYFE